MKILTIIGARPQFVKAATVSRIVAETNDITEILVHTGQHYDANMSDVFFEEMSIPKPDYHLGIGSGPHGEQTGAMLAAIENVLISEKPDWVLIYGDTNSTLAGALAAVKLHIPVAHVEAGLRSYNRKMPEEINRIVADQLSTVLFTPTDTASHNLALEGVAPDRIQQVGDVMYDAALFYAQSANERSHIMQDLKLQQKGFVLSTIHRAENTDVPERLKAILEGLAKVAENTPVVLPLHPRTKKFIAQYDLASLLPPGLKLIDPIGYFDMITLESNASVVATDSGGVQKEAYFFGTPCVTLRDETEWVELIETGWNTLCSPQTAEDVQASILSAEKKFGRKGKLYGEGNSAQKVVNHLLR